MASTIAFSFRRRKSLPHESRIVSRCLEPTVDDLMRFAGVMSVFVWVIALSPFLLLGLAIPYIVLWMRDQKNVEHDPQIGIKASLYYFFSISILLIEAGLTVIAVDMIVETRPARTGLTVAQRTGAALLVAGALGTLSHLMLIKGLTNDSRWPATRRLFVGWRFAVNGLVVVTTFTALIVAIFQKDTSDGEIVRSLIAILLIWLPGWGFHLILLHLYRDQPLPLVPREPEPEEEPAPPLSDG